MKIAFVVPSLANKGPIIVARDLVNEIAGKKDVTCIVYYLDRIEELDFNCEVKHITSPLRIDFSGFDIVHTHMLRPDVLVAFKRKKFRNTKIISTIHSYMNEDLANSYGRVKALLARSLWCFMLNRFDRVVCLSNDMKRYYSRYIRTDLLAVINNGRTLNGSSGRSADIPPHEASEIERLKAGYKIIGAIGNVTKIKGFEQLIKALVINPGYAVIVIGEGVEKNELIRLANESGVANRCLFLGYKANARDYYKYFDVYAVTSYSEGFPLVLLEAASHGLPTLCSDLSIFKEIFTDNEVCFYKLFDIEDLSRGLDMVIQNAATLSSNIRKKYMEKYTSEVMGENYLSLYKTILST